MLTLNVTDVPWLSTKGISSVGTLEQLKTKNKQNIKEKYLIFYLI
tara:strand:- start:637 stop:771 length:135 start_codon:yes stop_codon:yes gene_type:complete